VALRRFVVLVAVAVATAGFVPRLARADASCAAGGFGNAGFAAGYGTSVTRWGCGLGSGRGWCAPRTAGWCVPPVAAGCWRPPLCMPRSCQPWWGPSWCGPVARPCWPSWCGPGWGGWGSTTVIGRDSVFLAVPSGGGGFFFSGGIRPVPWCGWPTNWMPTWGVPSWGGAWWGGSTFAPVGFGPQFGPAGVMPFVGAAAASGSPRRIIASRPAVAPIAKAANAQTRQRAAKLVATGDGHLRAAAEDPARLAAAVDAYRRAAAIVRDDPDLFVRQALALDAQGRRDQAGLALARAVAIDGRLGKAAPVAVAVHQPDPVFGDRPAGSPGPLEARGLAVLRQIGADQPGAFNAGGMLARLAADWSTRFGGEARAVAAAR
jgi:hypothetical protein